VETIQYVYDGDAIVFAFDGSDALTNRYLQGPMVDQILADEDDTGDVLWALTDNLGSVRDLVENDGTVANHITYDAYGNITSETATSVDHIYAFTGRERDEESDLQFNRARFYDAGIGQWISEDPIGFDAGDANIRRYVSNAPSAFTDPTGLQPRGWTVGDTKIFVPNWNAVKPIGITVVFETGVGDRRIQLRGDRVRQGRTPLDHIKDMVDGVPSRVQPNTIMEGIVRIYADIIPNEVTGIIEGSAGAARHVTGVRLEIEFDVPYEQQVLEDFGCGSFAFGAITKEHATVAVAIRRYGMPGGSLDALDDGVKLRQRLRDLFNNPLENSFNFRSLVGAALMAETGAKQYGRLIPNTGPVGDRP
jgi:RHS repeat-associated protein